MRVDDVGMRLFGTALRLRVAFTVMTWPRDTFYQQEIARSMEYRADYVGRELEILETIGLIERVGEGRGVKNFRRTESPLWKPFEAFREVLDD